MFCCFIVLSVGCWWCRKLLIEGRFTAVTIVYVAEEIEVMVEKI